MYAYGLAVMTATTLLAWNSMSGRYLSVRRARINLLDLFISYGSGELLMGLMSLVRMMLGVTKRSVARLLYRLVKPYTTLAILQPSPWVVNF